MPFQKVAFTLLGVLILISNFQLKPIAGVRLCGRQLADLLNTICERRGGFHTPRENPEESSGSTSKRAVIDILSPITRWGNVKRTNDDAELAAIDSEIDFNFQNGIVDECCRKPCSFTTLVSYCADGVHSDTINLEAYLPAGSDEMSNTSDEAMEHEQRQMPSSGASASSADSRNSNQEMHSSNLDNSQRPNLGLSNRSRPVFIVLPQASEDGDQPTGEYRF